MIRSVGILGCGWLGRAIAMDLAHAGTRVVASTTRAENLEAIASVGADVHLLSFMPDMVGEFAPFRDVEAIVVSIPPSRGIDPVEQAAAVAAAIGESGTRHVVHISSTSLYPKNGERVSEDDASPDHPLTRVELEYKRLTKTLTTLRCAGLFGPGRLILPALLRLNRAVDEAAPVNFVEQADVVRAVHATLASPVGGVFNICADEHPTKGVFYRSIAERSGLPVPTFSAESEQYNIVDNERFKESFGFEYSHPDPNAFPIE